MLHGAFGEIRSAILTHSNISTNISNFLLQFAPRDKSRGGASIGARAALAIAEIPRRVTKQGRFWSAITKKLGWLLASSVGAAGLEPATRPL